MILISPCKRGYSFSNFVQCKKGTKFYENMNPYFWKTISLHTLRQNGSFLKSPRSAQLCSLETYSSFIKLGHIVMNFFPPPIIWKTSRLFFKINKKRRDIRLKEITRPIYFRCLSYMADKERHMIFSIVYGIIHGLYTFSQMLKHEKRRFFKL